MTDTIPAWVALPLTLALWVAYVVIVHVQRSRE